MAATTFHPNFRNNILILCLLIPCAPLLMLPEDSNSSNCC